MNDRRPVDGQHVVLTSDDGVGIDAVHLGALDDGDRYAVGFVVVHGFTGGWRAEHVRRATDRLRRFGGVVAIDQRGHGRSEGASTVGHDEVRDVAAAVRWARDLGYRAVVSVGFSLGGAVVVRQAALVVDSPVDAVVSVSAPAFWYYRGTRVMRTVHRLVLTRAGRLVLRTRGTRVSEVAWPDPPPVSPADAAALLTVPLLVVHGDIDRYFPVEHARALHAGARVAGVPTDLWIERDVGHAERAVGPLLLDRIGGWARSHVGALPDP